MTTYNILVIYPDPLATTVALFKNTSLVFTAKIPNDGNVTTQTSKILQLLVANQISSDSLSIIVSRAGLTKQLPRGVYTINDQMVDDLSKNKFGSHESNIGAIISHEIGNKLNKPSYIVDPPYATEMDEIAQFTGMPEIKRKGIIHTLAQTTAAKRTAMTLGKEYQDCTFVVAHIGVGNSVGVHKDGKIIDSNNVFDEAPFSIERMGRVPIRRFIKLAYSKKFTKEQLITKYTKESGIYAYLKTKDPTEIENLYKQGDSTAKKVLNAMIYQLAKEIGIYATTVCGKLDGVIVSGNFLQNKQIVQLLKEHVSYLGSLFVYPECIEITGLAEEAYAVLTGEIAVQQY